VAGKQALVVGASGLLGTNFLEHLASLGDWDIVALSRRPIPVTGQTAHVALDLLDRAACAATLSALTDVTHVFYLSRAVEGNYQIKVDANVEMLKNLVDHLEPAARRLEHVQLMHGCKWYGVGAGPFRTPAKESHPRPALPIYYYGQHDYLSALQRGKRWNWSTLRPHFVNGVAVRSPSNLVSVIGVYATILRELGMPLTFPGSDRAFDALLMYADLGLLARAMVWAATEPRCANQDFNIANGDYFRWRDVWPDIAAQFGMVPGPARPMKLLEFMSDKAPVWERALAKHGLQHTQFADVADWGFADSVFRLEWDQTMSVVKAHRHGFCEMVDSENMLTSLLNEYRKRRIIP
jgi:nucleoside-diphosphate-sugar epimerase